jgi:hypothetical protein
MTISVTLTDTPISVAVSADAGAVSVLSPAPASVQVGLGGTIDPSLLPATVWQYTPYGNSVLDTNLTVSGDLTVEGSLSIGSPLAGGSVLIDCGTTELFNDDTTVTEAFQTVEQRLVQNQQLNALGNTGSSKTLSFAGGGVKSATLSANCTFTMPTPNGSTPSMTLILKQGGTGYTASFTSVKWPGNTAPTITATNGKTDIIRFVTDGNYWYGSIQQNY